MKRRDRPTGMQEVSVHNAGGLGLLLAVMVRGSTSTPSSWLDGRTKTVDRSLSVPLEEQVPHVKRWEVA